MSVWRQFFCGCTRPNVKELFTFNTEQDVCLKDGGPDGVNSRKLWGKPRPCNLAKRNELLPTSSDQVSVTILDHIADVNVRGPPIASVAWRRSSSNADTLAPLAEDETLAPLEKRAFDDAHRVEWNEASRRSCPTLVARGFSSSVNHEPAAGGGQPAIRPHSLTAVPKNGFCVSPVSAATSRSLASPMRHDFMTLMRQASNRGSSCGLAAESAGHVSPQPWSPALAPDGCRGVGMTGHIHAAEWAAAAAARQTIGGDALALERACYLRERRASAFTVGGVGCSAHVRSAATNTNTGDGSAAVYSPPCPLSAVTATATFARCSSSPDMRPGGLMLGPGCPGRSSGGALEVRLVQSPYTAPPSVGHQASNGDGFQSDDGDGGGVCSSLGGNGGVLTPVMLRVLQPGPGRNGLELRSVQTPSPSPLRPRDLPPPVPTATTATTTATAMVAAGVAAASMTGAHSASALPKYCCPANVGLLRKRPASSASCRRGSYQQVRLLQQLKEQHELYLQQSTPAMAVVPAFNASAIAAAAVAPGAPTTEAAEQELQLQGDTDGGKSIEVNKKAVKWVEAYFSTGSHSCANSYPEAEVVSTVAEQLEILPIEGSFAADSVDDSAAAAAEAKAVDLDATTADAIGGAGTGGGGGADKLFRKPPAVPAVPRSPSSSKLSSTSAISAPAPTGSCWTVRNRCFTTKRFAGAKDGRGSGGSDCSWGVSAQDNMSSATAALSRKGGRSGAAVELAVELAVEPRNLGSDSSDRNLSRCVVEEAIVVGSLGDTLSIATKEFGPACAGLSSSQAAMVSTSVDDPESQVLQVIQNLLLLNVLPDNTAEPRMEDASSTTAGHGPLLVPLACGHRASLSSSLFDAIRSHQQGTLSEGFSSVEADAVGNSKVSRHNRGVVAAAAAVNGDDVEAPMSWAAAFGGSRGALAIHSGGSAGAAGGFENGQGQSPFIPPSSLTAVALLRSAGLICPLPSDASGANGRAAGGTGCHFSITHAGRTDGGATSAAGTDVVGLDTDGPSAAAIPTGSSFVGCVTSSVIEPCLTTDPSRCAPLVSSSSYVAWPPLTPASPLMVSTAAGQRPPSSPGRPSATLQSLPQFQTTAIQQSGTASAYSLRLEDGLVSDPLLLVDGLGLLSYVTSGAYAAVYQGKLEGIPVGIKFLASTTLDLSTPAVKEALLGPGLEHKNIIRTYTTRVARVDGRAVAQLKSVAAAMAAATVMHHKRSSAGLRRYSSGTICAPLSVPSAALSIPLAAAGRPAMPLRHTHGMVTSPSGIADARPPCPIARLSPPAATLPAVVATAANSCNNGGGISGGCNSSSTRRVADGTGNNPHLQGQIFPGGPVINTANTHKPVASPASCNAISSAAVDISSHLLYSDAAGNEAKRRFVSVSGVEQSHTAMEAAAALPPRQMYFRKSASANARAGNELVASDADLAVEAATPTQQQTPWQPQPVQLSSPSSQHAMVGADTRSNLVLRVPLRRGSAHIPHMPGGRALLVPQLPPLSQPLQMSPMAGPRTHTTASASVKRSGSAAERMLHVLSMLGVIGPTGQLTAEAHYVTAVVMEFADMGNLDTFSRSAAPCNLATAVDLLGQVARGMSYLHAHGLVHGDLKPANVLLMKDPFSGKLTAKVADFGLSGLSGQLGSNGGADTCGTVAYSAPERLAEEEGAAEQAADVYSFGICMQQLVSGVRPYAELTFGQVMFSVLCLKMRPSWPEGRCGALEPLYNMCCHSQPTKRPTFDQVVAWLDSLCPTGIDCTGNGGSTPT
ncbi:hypothetical protein Vretimale_17047 [Volvox reticuliferus]|uniref:Protein kinase domain-containing protein n=1 Tax=Volvox reticuliferus TaxID=1737510 RepID=A0A8J4LXZ9_9CHLO|nr:hypothetical protein Vretifemale_18648 [Volvox reticuliferus]GIM14028.1 hypothetical protein Vretimale_17047 [Volvox reticuliferus]